MKKIKLIREIIFIIIILEIAICITLLEIKVNMLEDKLNKFELYNKMYIKSIEQTIEFQNK